jgi:hypothetical protein
LTGTRLRALAYGDQGAHYQHREGVMRRTAATWILLGGLAVLPTDLREPPGGSGATLGDATRLPVPSGTGLDHPSVRGASGTASGVSAGRVPRERVCPSAETAGDLIEAALAWARCSDAWTDVVSDLARSAAATVLRPLVRTLVAVLAPAAIVVEWPALGPARPALHPEEVS